MVLIVLIIDTKASYLWYKEVKLALHLRSSVGAIMSPNRFKDLSYFTFHAEKPICVQCPKCKGMGIVHIKDNLAYFNCSHCPHSLIQERTLYRYDVHNHCSNCGRYYRVDLKPTDAQNFNKLMVACPYCGTKMQGQVHKTAYCDYYCSSIKQGCDPFFNLPLWFLSSFNGKLVWALNREHLNYLIDYLSATLREKPTTYPLKTQSDHLPTFMKTAKNRERIVKILRKMQQDLLV